LRGIRATTGRLRAVTARTTTRVTFIAWPSPAAAWKKIDVTAAEPVARVRLTLTVQLRDIGVAYGAGVCTASIALTTVARGTAPATAVERVMSA
jgi:hypothetical protein